MLDDPNRSTTVDEANGFRGAGTEFDDSKISDQTARALDALNEMLGDSPSSATNGVGGFTNEELAAVTLLPPLDSVEFDQLDAVPETW